MKTGLGAGLGYGFQGGSVAGRILPAKLGKQLAAGPEESDFYGIDLQRRGFVSVV